METVKSAKERGFRIVLASNPIFPTDAQIARLKWAGVAQDEMEYITSYENCSYCKPNPEYYLAVAKHLDVRPEQCLMIDNDVAEDMIAETVGMSVFLLTDHIINRRNKDISVYPNGDFSQAGQYIKEII